MFGVINCILWGKSTYFLRCAVHCRYHRYCWTQSRNWLHFQRMHV